MTKRASQDQVLHSPDKDKIETPSSSVTSKAKSYSAKLGANHNRVPMHRTIPRVRVR